MHDDTPHGFILSEAALYAFQDQDVFPDLISFSAAIPDHLKPLFLIPIRIDTASGNAGRIASRIASFKIGDGIVPSGATPEGDLFGVKTFVYEDNEPTVPTDDPGSIFDIDGADAMTHHQEDGGEQDENIQVPTETSYMNDVDMTQYWDYPYRTEESPIRHSSRIVVVRVSLKPDQLESRAPEDVRERAGTCAVSLVSYDQRGRVFTFSVNCGSRPHDVRASLTDLEHIAMNCDCEFWQWNGPEFHAAENAYMLGNPRGTASPPDVRDPDRKYYLCKHTYAVLTRLDHFVQEVAGKGELDDEAVLLAMDQNWSDMEEVSMIPLDEVEDENVEVDWESDDEVEPEELDEESDEDPSADDTPDIEFEEEDIGPEELDDIEQTEEELRLLEEGPEPVPEAELEEEEEPEPEPEPEFEEEEV